MSGTIRYKLLYSEWKKVQDVRDKIKRLSDQKRKLDKELRSLAQLLPKLLDNFDDKV